MRETKCSRCNRLAQEILVRFLYTCLFAPGGFPASKTCSHFGHCICVKSIRRNLSAGIENPHDGQNVRNTAANWQWWLRREVPSRSEYSRKSAQSKIRCTLERLRSPHQTAKGMLQFCRRAYPVPNRTEADLRPNPVLHLCIITSWGGSWALNGVYSGILATPHRLSGLSGQSSF